MARPRSFDMDTVLDGAMDIFWRQGYMATNLPDLLGAMGLTRGSFYKAFADKQGAYLAALDRYDSQVVDRTVAALQGCTGPTAGHCLGLLFAAPWDPGRGCFICNAMVELGPFEEDVAARTNQMAAKLRDAITQVLVRHGDGDGDDDAGDVALALQEKADLILHLYFGHQAMGKTAAGRDAWPIRLAHILGEER